MADILSKLQMQSDDTSKTNHNDDISEMSGGEPNVLARIHNVHTQCKRGGAGSETCHHERK